MKRFIGILAALALALAQLTPLPAFAAATTQTTHAFLCLPAQAAGSQARRVVVPTTAGGTYQLNAAGCAVVVAADIGWFLTQGAYYGPNQFVTQQQAITTNTTATTSALTLPAYGFIQYFILEETAGNAVTGGVDIGDASSATFFGSAVALGANATVIVVDSALTRLKSNSGVPVSDQILIVCHTSCNSASINVSVIYGYY